jgi:hypothetical protein
VDTVHQGIRWVVVALTIGFCLAALTDIYLEWSRRRSISSRLQAWSRRYPLYAGAMVLVFGALLGHFLLHGD